MFKGIGAIHFHDVPLCLFCSFHVFFLTVSFLFICRARGLCCVMDRVGVNSQLRPVSDVLLMQVTWMSSFWQCLTLIAGWIFPKVENYWLSTYCQILSILLSILFIITNCGLHSHAGFEGLQRFINSGALASGAAALCFDAPGRLRIESVFFRKRSEKHEHLFRTEQTGSDSGLKNSPLKSVANLSHSDLLKWVIHSEWIVHNLHVTHLQGTKRRVTSLYSLVSHPLLCSSTSGTLTCSNSNILILLLKQCEATGPRRTGTGKSFLH